MLLSEIVKSTLTKLDIYGYTIQEFRDAFEIGLRSPACLSPRALATLKGLANGKTVRMIAEELGISPKTVDTYKAQIHSRLGIQRRAHLVLYAVTHRLIEIDPDSFGTEEQK